MNPSRRKFLQAAALGLATTPLRAIPSIGRAHLGSPRQEEPRVDPGERPPRADGVTVLNPRDRVPVSFIIDDSTCLVNMAHFGIPQFHEVFPSQYPQDWRSLPREIPDSFVRSFGEWCRERGVKGKYSIVPYPACVGWVDRFLPGWTKQELEDSLALVRDFLTPDWDIHPEMISHTRVIDIATGRPYPHATPEFMENWEWSQTRSADELAAYLAYALRILDNAGLPCEGITTPGGFGSRNQNNLAIATLQSVRDVYRAEIPHYFRDLYTEPDISVAPRVYHASGLRTADPQCVVSIIGCTGDWFGGWDGLEPGSADRFITEDLSSGRLVEVIDQGEPAVLVCHWPGIYYNGEEVGFTIFKTVVERLHSRYDNLVWMKLSEISRYWAAKELTAITRTATGYRLDAPFACPAFTLALPAPAGETLVVEHDGRTQPLERVETRTALRSGTWTLDGRTAIVCFDLPKGPSDAHG